MSEDRSPDAIRRMLAGNSTASSATSKAELAKLGFSRKGRDRRNSDALDFQVAAREARLPFAQLQARYPQDEVPGPTPEQAAIMNTCTERLAAAGQEVPYSDYAGYAHWQALGGGQDPGR